MNYKIDAKTSNLFPSPVMNEGTLGNMSLVKAAGKVWKPTEMTFSFTSPNGLPNQGIALFEFKA